MPLRYQKRLLAHLEHDAYVPASIDQIAADLRVDDPAAFASAVRDLAREGIVGIGPTGLVHLPSYATCGGEIVGRFRRNPRGFGFVEPERPMREGPLFVAPHSTGDAMSGDLVRAQVKRDPRRRGSGAGEQSPFVGTVVEVIERKRASFTGVVERHAGQWIVLGDSRDLPGPVVARDAQAKNVRPGDKVVVELVVFPEGDAPGEAVITRVLGEAGRPDVETQAVIAAFSLREEFPSACNDEARALTRAFHDEIAAFEAGKAPAPQGRLDLTRDFIITIDPPDAKDYDDAISIERTEGGWKLGVHIADVGHFVQPGSALDTEARARGNSTYLPRLVIPMLPELLSNGICSLQERVTRCCKSAFIEYDRRGEVRRTGVASTLIRSAKRLTYLEAQALIDGRPDEAQRHARTEPAYTDQLVAALRDMDALARAIQERRRRQGMISLELPECVLIYDDEGRVVDAEREDDAFTHTLIEMFMVEANETLAHLFEGVGVPLIRRVHPEPTPGDAAELGRAAKVAGFTIPAHPTREDLQALLDATRGTPAARAVHMAVLRTLTKAEYSPALIGHFALASEAYAHFTSPIRRYPDLTVNWALSQYLRLTGNGERRPRDEHARRALGQRMMESPLCPPESDLVATARHCTMTEVNSEEAENQLRKLLVLQLLAGKIGETYAGVVTGCSHRGVFVQLDKFLVDGFIKREDLPGDITRSSAPPLWKMDERTGALVDARSGRSFRMGDLLTVTIAAVNLAQRQLDLVIADPASRAAGKSRLQKLALGGPGGGLAHAGGAGFDRAATDGSTRRSRRSKSRERGKQDFRQQRRDHGKR
jgi:ribonuclease R